MRQIDNDRSASEVRLEKVISGGQTGVDRAALDAAMEAGFAVGGWCPKGRRAEDGRIADRYPLRETASEEYGERTTQNVRDSDGTLVLVAGEPTGGTAFTLEEARRLDRPHLVVDPSGADVNVVVSWLRDHAIRTLNVAGPREVARRGCAEDVYDEALAFLGKLLTSL